MSSDLNIIEAAEALVAEFDRLEPFRRVGSMTEHVDELRRALHGASEPDRVFAVEKIPPGSLPIFLLKLAKSISYYNPGFRAALLREAARRLLAYRQAERRGGGEA